MKGYLTGGETTYEMRELLREEFTRVAKYHTDKDDGKSLSTVPGRLNAEGIALVAVGLLAHSPDYRRATWLLDDGTTDRKVTLEFVYSQGRYTGAVDFRLVEQGSTTVYRRMPSQLRPITFRLMLQNMLVMHAGVDRPLAR